MSTDFNVVCDGCKVRRHLGQRMGGTFSFGYGTGDVEEAAKAMEFIDDHYNHGVRISISDCLQENRPEENYEDVEDVDVQEMQRRMDKQDYPPDQEGV